MSLSKTEDFFKDFWFCICGEGRGVCVHIFFFLFVVGDFFPKMDTKVLFTMTVLFVNWAMFAVRAGQISFHFTLCSHNLLITVFLKLQIFLLYFLYHFYIHLFLLLGVTNPSYMFIFSLQAFFDLNISWNPLVKLSSLSSDF